MAAAAGEDTRVLLPSGYARAKLQAVRTKA
jgi:hypothetical protein